MGLLSRLWPFGSDDSDDEDHDCPYVLLPPDEKVLTLRESTPQVQYHRTDVGVKEIEMTQQAWKVVDGYLIKLLIPKGATVVRPESRDGKMRANAVYVDEVWAVEAPREPDHAPTSNSGFNYYDVTGYVDEVRSVNAGSFTYQVGEITTNRLNTCVQTECTEGLHFFRTAEKALNFWPAKATAASRLGYRAYITAQENDERKTYWF